MAGLYVRGQYQRIAIKPTEFLKEYIYEMVCYILIFFFKFLSNIRSPFKKYIDTSVTKLEKRLNDKAIECYADEKNVGVEMHRILKATLTHGREFAANVLLEFLEEKYDNKKWIVIMQINNSGDLDSVWSGGFHHVSVNNHVVLALSVDRDRNLIQFKNLIQVHLKEFNIVTKFTSYPIGWFCLDSLTTEEYLKRLLSLRVILLVYRRLLSF